ncbi:hypothetical protein [Alicyclobacillus fastidiosus]|uniref:Uncharacterized protein n=1 Tax=Alicyclobacillus fastidiosus TaxID=392011 RepID=A0ABV5ALH7_9BACL|nr:hypothetical protein [Alicyclobacillus fastidiosus]WEH11080.1 hypothetical protein PYS47_07645 [Alicyclobacillus fastidiosus]
MAKQQTNRSKQPSHNGKLRNETVDNTEANTNTLVTRINTFVNRRNTAITVINTIVTVASIAVALRAMRRGENINDMDDQPITIHKRNE